MGWVCCGALGFPRETHGPTTVLPQQGTQTPEEHKSTHFHRSCLGRISVGEYSPIQARLQPHLSPVSQPQSLSASLIATGILGSQILTSLPHPCFPLLPLSPSLPPPAPPLSSLFFLSQGDL